MKRTIRFRFWNYFVANNNFSIVFSSNLAIISYIHSIFSHSSQLGFRLLLIRYFSEIFNIQNIFFEIKSTKILYLNESLYIIFVNSKPHRMNKYVEELTSFVTIVFLLFPNYKSF